MSSEGAAEAAAAATTSTVVVPFQTTIRQQITPYLPPPVISTIKTVDSTLQPYVGDEAFINILLSFLLGYVLYRLVSLVGRKGKAIQDLEEEDVQEDRTQQYYDTSLLLCGPTLSGKTTLFYYLLGGQRLQTIRSSKSNIGYVSHKSTNVVTRIVDTPGCWNVDKVTKTFSLDNNVQQTIAVVVDSTQPVASAVDYVYPLLCTGGRPIIVVCSKCNHPKAKNVRRLKLQLRNELERYDHLQATQEGGSSSSHRDWETIMNQNTTWCSTNIDERTVMVDEFMKQIIYKK
jgi:GTPase SAR1 family protein